MSLEEKYAKLLAFDESLANEFLVNAMKLRVVQGLKTPVVKEDPKEVEEKSEEMRKDEEDEALDRAEVMAQLDDLGVEYSTKDKTSRLHRKLQKTLSAMNLNTPKISPKKAECSNTVITKAPENKKNSDIITEIIKEANYTNEEDFRKFNEDEDSSDW